MIALATLLIASADAPGETLPSASSFPRTAVSAWVAAAAYHRIDPIDLYAIALQESRRRRADGWMRAWPWTLNSPRTGPLYFETYEAALKKLTALIREGETNIDVGIMQINWYFNGHRAGDPGRLLRAADNIFIAAQIYREQLDRCAGDRRKALARYHNRKPALGEPYAAAVMTIADHLRVSNGVHLSRAP
jgi:hypothetical protein